MACDKPHLTSVSFSIIQTLSTYPITTLCSAPTVYRMLVQKDLKRYVGGTLPLNDKEKQKWGQTILLWGWSCASWDVGQHPTLASFY